jgi:hypothetical protein
MNLFRRKDPTIAEDLKRLEMQLRLTLQPVAPRLDFVNSLQARLLSSPFQSAAKPLPQKISHAILVFGGILGSILMIVTGIRGLISLVSVVRLVVQTLSRNSQKRQTTPA